MSTRRFSKNKLSLALATALVGGVAVSSPALAVDLDNSDRLGDAAIFPYYTAQGDWQTFIRLINTSEDAILLKVRFREAANSREVLDFEVALSPHDVWTAWTDKAALEGHPGIRSNDTSCVFPPPDTNPIPGESFKTIDAATHLIGAEFESRAFTGVYDDNGNAAHTPLERMSEGHLEVIGVAKYDCNASNLREQSFCRDVSHAVGTGGIPLDCDGAYNLVYGEGGIGDDVDNAGGDDMHNVLATNAYLINVPAGQGAGYDPDMLVDCTDQSLELELIATDTNPDLDSCRAGIYGVGHEDPWSVGPVAVNQRLWNGDTPPPTQKTFLQADLVDGAGNPWPGATPDGAYTGSVSVDLNGDGQCTGAEVDIPENDVPQKLYDAAIANKLAAGPGGCDYAVVTSGGFPPFDPNVENSIDWLTSERTETVYLPWRIKQKGQFVNWESPWDGTNQFPVTGGVDDVSRELMRTSVINEWAASFNPENIITDYFTQWVVTFPTKHYYVDLQDDGNTHDDISPTLVDISPDNDAFAPFSQEFDDGDVPGTSCEPFTTEIWNRDERYVKYSSPAPTFPSELCYETNVINFNERYADRGLASNFAVTIPEGALPTDFDGKVSQRGWAKLTFSGPGATQVGLGHPWRNFYGLPVTGFMLSNYVTHSTGNNHAAANAHKYTRDWEGCTFDQSSSFNRCGREALDTNPN